MVINQKSRALWQLSRLSARVWSLRFSCFSTSLSVATSFWSLAYNLEGDAPPLLGCALPSNGGGGGEAARRGAVEALLPFLSSGEQW